MRSALSWAGKASRLHPRVLLTWLNRLSVVVNHFVEGRQGAVKHVRSRFSHIAQRGRLEGADVRGVEGQSECTGVS